MRGLSISAAWEETKAILARDGRLLTTVALALVALPSAVNSFLARGAIDGNAAQWLDLVALLASVIALAGQLALIRLALGPSITVGGAIVHGFRRLPIYFLAVMVLLLALFIVAIPLGLLLVALGVPISAKQVPASGPVVLVTLIFAGIAIFLGVRFLLSSSVASAEEVGPIAILKRSWELTAGHFWRLFGFLLAVVVAAVVLLIAVGSALGVAISLSLGSIQPLSTGALILALIQALVSAAVTTLFAVMLARIYVQLAGRGEAQPSVPSSGI
jgi:hypothetical protein